jgi:rhamnose transport system ATP-binding protein
MAALLKLDAITKSFQAVRALRGVSLTVEAGEVHAILGENGAGKSTLIKVITGAHQPDGGEVWFNGKKAGHLSPARARELGVAAIYQQPALFPDLTVAENIAMGLEKPSPFRRVRWNERNRRARELLQSVGAEIQADTEVRQLSMPQQQLVEIARALGAGARILIMDEPTASLTSKEVELLFSVIREMRRRGVSVIYISHRLDEIFSIADRMTVLRDGQSVATHWVGEINEAGLIRLMVGREVSAIYPPALNTPGATVLSLKNLGCAAAGVHDVSMDVRAGEVLGLAGLVGAGRTELARVLFGITPADSGQVELNGKTIRIDSPRDAIGLGIAYLPEDRRRHGIVPEMSVASNATLAILNRFFPGGWLRPEAEDDLARKFISDLSIKVSSPSAPASSLSGGNQQKVALSRWLAAEPKVLILDEPTQGVDIGAKAEIHKIIRQLAARGMAVIMISSDLPEVLGMSARIAVMRQGGIAAILDASCATGHSIMAAALGRGETQNALRSGGA